MPRISKLLALPLATCLAATAAYGHDLGSIAHPSNTGPESVLSPSRATLQQLPEKTRSVIVNSSKWPIGYKLKVCFYGGGQATRQAIMTAATTWLDGGGINLTMDFGPAPALRDCANAPNNNNLYEDIRIDFRGAGYWSYIGVDGHRVLGPSMNFQNFDMQPALDAYMNSVVLHEFGHALGLHHEHQSPGSPCAGEFNLPLIKQMYGWSDAQIATNFAALANNSSIYVWGPYDPKSIMMYSLPAQVLFKGNQSVCWVPQNYQISGEDRLAIRRAYPSAPSMLAADRTRGADELISTPNLPPDLRNRAWMQKVLATNN